jgi:hypothetical protein
VLASIRKLRKGNTVSSVRILKSKGVFGGFPERIPSSKMSSLKWTHHGQSATKEKAGAFSRNWVTSFACMVVIWWLFDCQGAT